MPLSNVVEVSSYFSPFQATWLLILNFLSLVSSLFVIFILLAFWKKMILFYIVTKSALRNREIVSSQFDLWQSQNSHCSNFLKWAFLLLIFNPGNSQKRNPVLLSFYFITAIVDFLNSSFRITSYLNHGLTGIKFIQSISIADRVISALVTFFSILSILLRILVPLQLYLIIVIRSNYLVAWMRLAT
ncbi:hypothetical protein BB560_005474, partial [Smittium megazygosporum]